MACNGYRIFNSDTHVGPCLDVLESNADAYGAALIRGIPVGHRWCPMPLNSAIIRREPVFCREIPVFRRQKEAQEAMYFERAFHEMWQRVMRESTPLMLFFAPVLRTPLLSPDLSPKNDARRYVL